MSISEFEIWVLVNSESPVFAMSLGTARHCSQLPDDDFIPDMNPQLSASNLKQSNILLATISNEEIQAIRSQSLWKTRRNLPCELLVCSHHGQRSKISAVTRNVPLKCFPLVIQLSYVIGFACSWRRPGIIMDSHIHYVVSLNYFLAYSASSIQKYIPLPSQHIRSYRRIS